MSVTNKDAPMPTAFHPLRSLAAFLILPLYLAAYAASHLRLIDLGAIVLAVLAMVEAVILIGLASIL